MRFGQNLATGKNSSSFILQYDYNIQYEDVINLLMKCNFPQKIDSKDVNNYACITLTRNLTKITEENIDKYTYHITDEEYILNGMHALDKKYYLLVAGETGAMLQAGNWNLEYALQNLYAEQEMEIPRKRERILVDYVKW